MDWRPTSNETNDWVPILRNVSFLKIKKIISKYHKNGIVISAIIIITLTLSSNSKKTILASCQSNIYVIKSNVKSLSHSTKKYLAFWIYIFFCLLCKSRKRTNSNFLKKSIICHKKWSRPLCIDDSNSLTSFDAFFKETERRDALLLHLEWHFSLRNSIPT